MPALDETLAAQISLLAAAGQLRRPEETVRLGGARVLRGGKEYISFSCNDYLGLSHHPDVVLAAQEAAKKYGAGAGASPLVTGYHPLYAELEKALAEYKGAEAACLFSSGMLANIGTVSALAGKGDLIIADKWVHASLIDGARLSGAEFQRFAHNNLKHLAQLLRARRDDFTRCLIVVDGVYSMDGDVAPIQGLLDIAKTYDAWLLVDDAHGLGVLNGGKGSCEGLNVPIQTGTLSKALASLGGYVCGSRMLIDYIRTASRNYIYATGLPPANAAAAFTALNILKADSSLAHAALDNAQLLSEMLALKPAESAIVPLILREEEKALALSEKLKAHGFLVSAIRPPTVPAGSSRLRFAMSAVHEKQDIIRLAAAIKKEIA